jgi:flavin reductase (DIM6/NTAB) family NADH-FMN oxidoreductase RutF
VLARASDAHAATWLDLVFVALMIGQPYHSTLRPQRIGRGGFGATQVMASDEPPTIDHTLFRRVMSSFATGITIITTEVRGETRGMTANAFMSGSLEPPLCIVSVAKRARTHGMLVEAGHFGVSILAQGQEKLCVHFSGKPYADLQPVYQYIGRTPVLPGATATITADIVATHECGDHTIFVGRIMHLKAGIAAPLVLHAGRYAALMYSDEEFAAPVIDLW